MDKLELKNIMEEYDFSLILESPTPLGQVITRADIENTLLASGITLPLSRNVSFFIYDFTLVYSVVYIEKLNRYGYEKLSDV